MYKTKTATVCVLIALIGAGCQSEPIAANDDCQSLFACVTDTSISIEDPLDSTFVEQDSTLQDASVPPSDSMIIDASMDVDAGEDQPDAWVLPCEPTPGEFVETSEWIISQQINTKTPSGLGRIASINPTPDEPGARIFLTVSEGRVFQRNNDGDLRWQTGLLNLDTLNAIADLDGDGRLEVIASGRSTLVVLNATNGELLWNLPEDAFGETAFASIARIVIADVTGDGLKDLYLTNGGCGGGGDGKGLIYSFIAGEMRRIQQIFGQRLNGKCAAWQTLFDTNNDGRMELLVNDGNGLNAFDTLTNSKVACGSTPAPPNGPFPTYAFPSEDGPAWLAVINNQIHRLSLRETIECEANVSFVSAWQFDPGEDVNSDGAGLIFDAAGHGTHFVFEPTNPNEPNPIKILNLTSGALEPHMIQGTLMGVISSPTTQTPYILTKSTTAGAAVFVNIYGRSEDVWRAEARVASMTPELITEALGFHVSREFRRPVTIATPDTGTPRFLLSEGQETADGKSLSLVSPNGFKSILSENVFTGDARRVCNDQFPCQDEPSTHLIFTTIDGSVRSINPDEVTLEQEHFKAFSGTDQLIAIDGEPGYLGALSSRGIFSVYKETSQGFEQLWDVDVKAPRVKSPYGMGARINGRPVFVVRDARRSQAAWVAFDGETGAELWRHQLSDTEAFVFNQPVLVGGTNPIFMRMDYSQDGIIPTDETCPEMGIADEAAFFTPHPNCPNKAVRSRVITALNPETGQCQWRRIFKAEYPSNQPGVTYGCPGPVNQRLSVNETLHDRESIAFVTEGMTLRSFRTNILPSSENPGSFEHTAIFGKTPAGANIGGGQVSVTQDGQGLILHGGATPPILFNSLLEEQWATQGIELIRSQNWLLRSVVHAGNFIWTSASGGYPLIQLSRETGEKVNFWRLRDGQVETVDDFTPTHPALTQLVQLNDEGRSMIAVTTVQGFIYFFGDEGNFISSYRASTPVLNLSPINQTLHQALMFSTGGGRISILEQPVTVNPTVLLDVECPPRSTCEQSDDIDTTPKRTELCFAWIPVEDAIGYEVTIETENGLQLKAWQQVSLEPIIRIDDLDLIPGQRYIGAIRAIFDIDGRSQLSSIARSDGITVEQSDRPVAMIEANLDANILEIDASASDDDQLIRWQLDLVDADNGQVLRRVGSGALAATNWSESFSVDVTELVEAVPPIQAIVVELNVSDRSEQDGRAQQTIPLR